MMRMDDRKLLLSKKRRKVCVGEVNGGIRRRRGRINSKVVDKAAVRETIITMILLNECHE